MHLAFDIGMAVYDLCVYVVALFKFACECMQDSSTSIPVISVFLTVVGYRTALKRLR